MPTDTILPALWRCPTGECGHGIIVHDWDAPTGTEVCSVDGCPCGKDSDCG